MKKVADFYPKLTEALDNKYFPHVKTLYNKHHDDKNAERAHYACELFNNGCSTYKSLISVLSLCCNDSKENLHTLVSQFIQDLENYQYKP